MENPLSQSCLDYPVFNEFAGPDQKADHMPSTRP